MENIWLLSFFCLVYGFSGTQAVSRNLNGNDSIASINSISVMEKNQYFPLSDTLPGRNNAWEVLFDGKSTDKWRAKDRDSFPSNGWRIKDGSLF